MCWFGSYTPIIMSCAISIFGHDSHVNLIIFIHNLSIHLKKNHSWLTFFIHIIYLLKLESLKPLQVGVVDHLFILFNYGFSKDAKRTHGLIWQSICWKVWRRWTILFSRTLTMLCRKCLMELNISFESWLSSFSPNFCYSLNDCSHIWLIVSLTSSRLVAYFLLSSIFVGLVWCCKGFEWSLYSMILILFDLKRSGGNQKTERAGTGRRDCE